MITCMDTVRLVQETSIPQNTTELMNKIRKVAIHGGTMLSLRNISKKTIRDFAQFLKPLGFYVTEHGQEFNIYWDIDLERNRGLKQ